MSTCNAIKDILEIIGKPLEELSEDDWDLILQHEQCCSTCAENNHKAQKVIDEQLPAVLEEMYGRSKANN